MSELFPSRRKVVGGSAAGLGRIVNFVGAGGRTPDLGPAIGQIGDIFEQYADNHYAKVADEKLDNFTGEVLEAAQTFNFNQDASTFGDPFREKITIATEGLPARAAAAFSAAANKLVTRTQADLVGQAYDRDVKDRQTNDLKELGTLVSSLGPTIFDARLSGQQFELEDPASVFELSVENLVQSVDGIVDSIELKIESMRESGLYAGNEALLVEAQSRAIRETTNFLSQSFIASATEADLVEILNSAANNTLPENLSPLKEYYNRMSEEDQRLFNTDIQRVVRSQDANNKILRRATDIAINETITGFKLSLAGRRQAVDSQGFNLDLQAAANVVQSLKEIGMPELASKLSEVMTAEIDDFTELEIRQQKAMLQLPAVVGNFVQQQRLLGVSDAQIQARKNLIIDTVGKRGPSVGTDIGTVRGEIRDVEAVLNAFKDEITIGNKTVELDNKASIEKLSLFKLENSRSEFQLAIELLPVRFRDEFIEKKEALRLSGANPKEHVQGLDDLTRLIKERAKEYRGIKNAINTTAPGTPANRKAVDAHASDVLLQNIEQGLMPSIFAAFKETASQDLQRSVLADFGVEDDDDLNARVDYEDRLSKTFNFYKTELDRGYSSDQINQYIKSLSSASMPEDKDAADAMIENVMELAQGLHILYGTKTLLEENPKALTKYAGLEPREQSFVKTLSYLVQSGADESQYRNYFTNKHRAATKEELAVRNTFIEDALTEFDSMFGNPAEQLNTQGFLGTTFSSGAISDIFDGGRIKGYLRERMQRLLDIDPILQKEPLIQLAVDSLARDGLAFSQYGIPIDNPDSIDQEQRFSLNPPDRIYNKEIKNFLDFARSEITNKATLAPNFKFFRPEQRELMRVGRVAITVPSASPEAPDVSFTLFEDDVVSDQELEIEPAFSDLEGVASYGTRPPASETETRQQGSSVRLQGSAFVLDEMVFGENVFFKKTEFSSADRPTYYAVARSQNGVLTPLRRKTGEPIIIDYNDQFAADTEITRRKEINEKYELAALNRSLDLRTNLLRYATDYDVFEGAPEEVFNQRTDITDPVRRTISVRDAVFVNRQEPVVIEPMRSPEEYGDFDASTIVTDSDLNAVDPTTLPLGDNFMDPTASPTPRTEEYGDFDASPPGIEGPRNPEDISTLDDDARGFGTFARPRPGNITPQDFARAQKQAEREGRSVEEVLSEEYPDFDAAPEAPQGPPDLGELEGRNVAIKRLPRILNFTRAQQINLETPQNSDSITVDAAIKAVSSVFGGNTATFLTRIGRQESALGKNKATFKKGRVDRGIWQISPIGLEEIKRDTPVLRRARQRIQDAFGIDVMELSLDDLEKPLHGAIAARLFLHSKNRGKILPQSLASQAAFWKRYYNTAAGKGTVRQFIQNNSMAGV